MLPQHIPPLQSAAQGHRAKARDSESLFRTPASDAVWSGTLSTIYRVTSYTLEMLCRRLPAVCGSETYLIAITKTPPMRKLVQAKPQVTVADQESQATGRAKALMWRVRTGHRQPTADMS